MDDYHSVYNAQVVRDGEPYNVEALDYLDNEFKAVVTSALESCLNDRPEDPIRFLAEALKQAQLQCNPSDHDPRGTQGLSLLPEIRDITTISSDGSSYTATARPDVPTKEFVLTYPGGVTCVVRSPGVAADFLAPALTSPSPTSHAFAPATTVLDGLPLYHLRAPTVYELDSVLRNLEALNGMDADGMPLRTLVLVEPPVAPTELFFLQGIPYCTNLAETLAQHQRRGNASAPHPAAEQTHSQLALDLLAQSLGTRVSTLPAVLDSCQVECLTPNEMHRRESRTADTSMADARLGVVLPSVQSNCLEVFDAIDAGVQLIMGDSPCVALARLPTIVFVTYNTDADAAALTLARLLAAYLPHLEAQQRHGLAAMRQAGLATLHALSYDDALHYWDDVHDRREARDEARGVRRAGSRRLGRPGNGLGAASTPAESAPASPKTLRREVKPEDPAQDALRKKAAQRREARRQAEDSVFLGVLHDLRDRAATAIQAQYRGSRARRAVAENRRARSLPSAEKAPTAQDFGLDWTKPADVPPLLWFTLQELHRVYGEVFGPYPEGELAEPRVVRVHRPRRTPLPAAKGDGDVGSEADDWDVDEVLLPPARLSQPASHVNVLRRLLVCHALSDCHRLGRAAQVQRSCSGCSLLLRRSYDQLKSLALDLAHVAHVELVHRRRLARAREDPSRAAMDLDSFSVAMQKHFAPLLGALAHPHLLSRSVLGAAKDERTSLRAAEGIVDRTVINSEQLLVLAAEEASATRLGAEFQCIAPGVYVLPPCLGEGKWSREVGALREHAVSQSSNDPARPLRGASTAFGGTTPHDSSHLNSPNPSELEPPPTAPVPLGVTWWSLSPLPVAYVAGAPFALVPRANSQDVQGLASPEHVVPSIVSGGGPSDSEAAPRVALDGETGVELRSTDALDDGEAPLSHISRCDERSTHFEQVVDGVLAKRRSPQTSAPAAASLSVSMQALTPTSRAGAQAAATALDALFCSSLSAEEHRLRRFLAAQLAHHGGLVYYTASGIRRAEPHEDDKDLSVLPQWAFLSLGMLNVPASRKIASASALHTRFFEWVPSMDGNRSHELGGDGGGAAAGAGNSGRSGWLNRDGHGGEPSQRMSRENSVSGRSGRRRSLGRSGDALSRLRDSMLSSQRLSFAASGHNSPLISTSISPTTTPRTDALARVNSSLGVESGAAGAPTTAPSPNHNHNNRSHHSSASPHSPGYPPTGKSPSGRGGAGASRFATNAEATTPSGRHDARRQRRRLEQAREEVKSARDVAALVAAQHARDGVDLQYHRAWFLPMPFKSVLPRLEVFIDAALPALKTGTVLALSADVLDATQGLVVASTALLSLAVTRVETVKIGSHAGAIPAQAASPVSKSVPRRSQLGLLSAAARDGMDDGLQDGEEVVTLEHPKLLFLQDFVQLLTREVHRHGVQLKASLARVLGVLRSLGLPLLDDIVVAIEAAEHEPRPAPCRQRIISAVQATEQLCLLILFDTYLALPFVSTSLARDSTAPLPSFTTSVQAMSDVSHWIESIDPWKDRAYASPDPTHLRYSHWLRRWDSTHYICHGAI